MTRFNPVSPRISQLKKTLINFSKHALPCSRIGWKTLISAVILGLTTIPSLAQTPSDAAPSEPDSVESSVETASQNLSQTTGTKAASASQCQPGFGCVTNLPLPRYVSLKNENGNVRRGPGLTHRVDWIFTRPAMPLKLTAEYENWRRIEDQDGAGGWVHYALLSGVRSVLITLDMAQLHDAPQTDARVSAQAEMGVIARVLQCQRDWCRISAGGEKGWIEKTALWGVEPNEIFD